MKYLIMLGIVMLLALADWVTGFIKAVVQDKVSSKVMRTGGLKKLAEVVVMMVGILLDIGINLLSVYYKNQADTEQLAGILGIVCAIAVFAYITIMEVISILENYAAIFPEAAWALRLSKKLKNIEKKEAEAVKDETSY